MLLIPGPMHPHKLPLVPQLVKRLRTPCYSLEFSQKKLIPCHLMSYDYSSNQRYMLPCMCPLSSKPVVIPIGIKLTMQEETIL